MKAMRELTPEQHAIGRAIAADPAACAALNNLSRLLRSIRSRRSANA